jgi:hypothetical protein
VKTRSAEWYATIDGKKVPLSESKTTAMKLLKIKTGDTEIDNHLPASVRKQRDAAQLLERPLAEYVEEYRQALDNRNCGDDFVRRTHGRIEATLEACGFEQIEDLGLTAAP